MASYTYAKLLDNRSSGGRSGILKSIPQGTFGRVVDIILDSTHPSYQERGGTLALNGVFFRTLGTPTLQENDNIFFAYSSTRDFTKIPLIGEIVEIVNQPSENIDGDGVTSKKPYYRSIVNIWNSSHQNSYPDGYEDSTQADSIELGYNFEERPSIRPLQAYPGDTLIEGRLGQSIRFSGATHPQNTLSDGTNNGSPFTIIRNGQREAPEGDTPIVEDINRDGTSIYLVSNHSVQLEQANYKRLSYDDAPDEAHVYKGNQLLINSGRIFLNAKEESILLSGTESVGLNARTINLDGEDYLAIDADKIYLGEKARRTNRKEPVVLGLQYEAWLKDLIAILKSMARDFSTVLTPPQAAAVLSKQGTSINSKLPALEAAIENTLSKKVYSE
jgi:hypothetical protein